MCIFAHISINQNGVPKSASKIMSFNLNLLSCPKCGGKLKETNEGKYLCSFCERVWEKEIDDTFDKVLSGVTEALSAERAADIARLKRALYEETHKKYISNKSVEKICKDILNHYDDEDFYARFYLAACDDSRIAFSSFCEETDIASRKEDVPEILDYLITGLREEWITNVSDIIEKAYKGYDTDLYSKYRNKFEEMAERINEGIYEPTLHRDVFVMYSGKDMDKVLKMVSMLENDYGLSCFVAAKNLRHGAGSTDRYKDAIHEAIKNCDVYLLISSNNSRSRQCEVYEEVMYIMDNFPTHPRVEYLAENYKGYGLERKFKEFFSGLEWCISYEDTAERIAGYCDDIQRGVISLEGSSASVTVTEEEKITEPSPSPAKTGAIDALLVKAKRMLILEKYNEAFAEYERLADENPDDIRPYIGMVASVSENYTKTNCPEAELHINVINNFFGNDAGVKEDKNYAAYIPKLKEALKKAAEEEAARIRKEKEEAEKAKRLEEERIKREKEEAERRRKEEAARKAAEDARRLEEKKKKQRSAPTATITDARNYYYGRNGVTKDYSKAFKMFKELAENGNVEAQNFLGICYRNGHGVAQSNSEAVKWYRKAAEQGESYAQNNLGWCYDQGYGVVQSYSEAIKWYKKSIAQGNPLAQCNLGYLYYYGRGVAIDYYEAARLYRKSADQGNARAQCLLGFCYKNGKGVASDYAEAVKWYRKSADQGDAYAQNNLGWCYYQGQGVAQNYPEAIKWYKKAVDQGNALAQCNLGFCYEKGLGVAKNISEAVRLYRLAAKQGDETAIKNLKNLGYSV